MFCGLWFGNGKQYRLRQHAASSEDGRPCDSITRHISRDSLHYYTRTYVLIPGTGILLLTLLCYCCAGTKPTLLVGDRSSCASYEIISSLLPLLLLFFCFFVFCTYSLSASKFSSCLLRSLEVFTVNVILDKPGLSTAHCSLLTVHSCLVLPSPLGSFKFQVPFFFVAHKVQHSH